MYRGIRERGGGVSHVPTKRPRDCRHDSEGSRRCVRKHGEVCTRTYERISLRYVVGVAQQSRMVKAYNGS